MTLKCLEGRLALPRRILRVVARLGRLRSASYRVTSVMEEVRRAGRELVDEKEVWGWQDYFTSVECIPSIWVGEELSLQVEEVEGERVWRVVGAFKGRMLYTGEEYTCDCERFRTELLYNPVSGVEEGYFEEGRLAKVLWAPAIMGGYPRPKETTTLEVAQVKGEDAPVVEVGKNFEAEERKVTNGEVELVLIKTMEVHDADNVDVILTRIVKAQAVG